ncbi:hypothetical protein Pmani_015925 [Petrolisthes manimaculis]|uniref:Uncharacterized protein n=1 Tax=Petrolisthes manimaculis TaxID=1843537 RepID=A0AAE1U788_9EUCA|nr:hypothetical protein Pmani_015925 [Petrolisthes manimaculis]
MKGGGGDKGETMRGGEESVPAHTHLISVSPTSHSSQLVPPHTHLISVSPSSPSSHHSQSQPTSPSSHSSQHPASQSQLTLISSQHPANTSQLTLNSPSLLQTSELIIL